MQTYDFIMLFILVGMTLYGYSKGMAWQIAFLSSLIASYFVAAKFSDRFAPVFGDAAPWNKFVAMAAIYAGASLAIWLVFRVVRGAINQVRLQSFDRQMGAMLGAARGVLWCVGVTFFAVTLLPENLKQQVIGSRSGYYIARLLDEADAVVPAEIHQVIGPHLERLGQELNRAPGQPGFGQGQPAPGQGFQTGWPAQGGQQPAPATGWPNLPQGGTQPTQNGWPAGQNGWQAGANWPATPQPNRVPAQPAAWPPR